VHVRRVFAPVVVALAATTVACGTGDPSVRAEQHDKPVIVTGLPPMADLAEVIGGSDVVVIDLTPVGRSAHDLTLTPRQTKEVVDADLVIDVGGGLQPALTRAARRRQKATVDVLDSLDLPDRPAGTSGPRDPHVWMDPTIMGSIATLVGDAIADVLPRDAAAVRARAHRVVEADVRLDAQLKKGLQSCRSKVLATQHDAFGWFAARYGFTTAPLDGPVPDDDPAPDPTLLARVTPHLADGTIATLFSDPLEPSGWIEVLAEENGLDVASLDPYEGLTPEAESKGANYTKVLTYDLHVLQDELDCVS
jgi:zinc transport system substrate-binding protein